MEGWLKGLDFMLTCTQLNPKHCIASRLLLLHISALMPPITYNKPPPKTILFIKIIKPQLFAI